MRAPCLLLASVLVGASVPVQAPAAEAPAAEQRAETPTFAESLDVRLVNVDVFVTDRKGRPVLGLEREDFVLFEDDAEVEIAHFFAFDQDPVAAERAAPKEVEGGATAVGPAADEGPVLDLHVVLYLDNQSLVKADRNRLLKGLRRMAERPREGLLRFTVVTFDGTLRAWTRFTDDVDEIAAALEAVASTRTSGVNAASDYQLTMRGIQSVMRGFGSTDCGPCDCGWDQMTEIWEGYAQRSGERIESSAAGLTRLLSGVAPIPGRKAVVYASAGLQRRPGLSVAQYLVDLCPSPANKMDLAADRTQRYDEGETLELIAATANAGQVTFYPLAAFSVAANSASQVDQAPGLRPSALTSGERTRGLSDGLHLMADETGGRTLFKADQVFAALEEDAARFYALGFEPAHPADGAAHRIRVELREPRRGLELRFRRSYRDRMPDPALVH